MGDHTCMEFEPEWEWDWNGITGKQLAINNEGSLARFC